MKFIFDLDNLDEIFEVITRRYENKIEKGDESNLYIFHSIAELQKRGLVQELKESLKINDN